MDEIKFFNRTDFTNQLHQKISIFTHTDFIDRLYQPPFGVGKIFWEEVGELTDFGPEEKFSTDTD
jgi:hypothetical protein